jgi:hypothetical protein
LRIGPSPRPCVVLVFGAAAAGWDVVAGEPGLVVCAEKGTGVTRKVESQV